MNIYQPAQSAVTGILAPVQLRQHRPIHLQRNPGRVAQGFEQSSKLCVQYLAPIIKNRQYNFPPLGVNPFVGASARPNEITYSEDRLNPHLPPPVPPRPHRRPTEAGPLPAEAPLLGRPPPEATPTDPGQGLQGLMVPRRQPAHRRRQGHTVRRMIAAALAVACLSMLPGW